MSVGRGARPLCVLVVEDDDAVRRVIRDMLRWSGFAVREAADGPQALEAVSRGLPDVILLDALLPGQHGLEVLDRLSASAVTAAVPVVATTGSLIPDEVFHARGACAVLRKPFTARELRRAMARAAGAPPRPRQGSPDARSSAGTCPGAPPA